MDGSPKGAVLAVLGVLASAPSAAAPQPSAQASDEAHVEAARKAFKKGQEAMKVERWAAAEEQFRLACTLAPEKPKPHYYLARALAELGRWDDSMVEVERYLKLAPPNHEDASDALALRVRCEKERARTGVRLIVETTPPGAEVVLDDAHFGGGEAAPQPGQEGGAGRVSGALLVGPGEVADRIERPAGAGEEGLEVCDRA